MTLGQQISTLRKRKGFSQNDLGKQIGSSGDIIGKYERDEVKPSIEVVIKIADVLGVSLDFLAGKTDTELDADTVRRLQSIDKLPEEDKKHIFYTIDSLIKAAKLKSL
ncbi:MAG: helix-turn-helix transcriptional regulator [Flavobacteriales bacterium]|nr:helix-turn-helix transcriptional regulator [Flavobacteriales bacterium]